MTRNVRLVFCVAGVLAVAVAFVIGPLRAGYAITGVSLAFIVGLMGMHMVRAIGDWRLGHPGRFWRQRGNASSGAQAERRAA